MSTNIMKGLLAGLVVIAGTGIAQVGGAGPAWADDDNRGGAGPNDQLRVYLDEEVHPTAQELCPAPQLWQGDGNPPTTFQRKRHLDAGVELAIKAIIRSGADIPSTYVDGHGLVHIEVPAGPQSPTGTNANRAAWNFTYSYDVALDPSNRPLDHYDGELWVDLDPSERTKYLKMEMVRVGPTASANCTPGVKDLSGFGWEAKGTVLIPDDEGDPSGRVTQNSQNFGFGYYRNQIDGDPDQRGIQLYDFGPGEFDVVMILKEKSSRGKGDRGLGNRGRARGDDGDNRTVLHVVFDVVAGATQTP